MNDTLVDSLTYSSYVTYSLVLSCTFFTYDYVLTLSDEICLVWPSSWSLGKVLFILTHYLPFLNIAFSMYRTGAQSPDTTICHTIIFLDGSTVFISLFVSEVIMIMRLWALWNRSKRMGITLSAVFTVTGCVSGIMAAKFTDKYRYTDLRGQVAPVPPGCFTQGDGSNASFVSFLLLMSFELLMLSLTLVKGIQDLRAKPSSSKFLYNFYRDGAIYYALLSAASLINVLMLLKGPPQLSTLFLPPQSCLHSVLSSRILIRLREDAYLRRSSMTITASITDSVFAPNSEGSVVMTSWFGDADSNVATAYSCD